MRDTDLITSPQVAALLGKSIRTIHRLVDAGELTPTMKLPGPNGAYLFRRADVEALVTPLRSSA
jgi:excisionase family DNA binding protein